MSSKAYDYLFKLLLIGDSAVGKTCILFRFSDDSFNTTFIATIGIDFKIRTIEIDGKKIKLQIWDTAGQERFKSMAPMYYRGAVAAVVVYDVTNPDSFNAINDWIKDLKKICEKDVVVCIVGNKVDLRPSVPASITTTQGQQLAQAHNAFFFETSAKDNLGVADAFLRITQELIRTHKLTSSVGGGRPAPAQPADNSKCCP
eukprot:m.209927 g.209927  ORF g.209927 m.209927 type:complete len:201 (-) comp53954_c0_seq2:163-765(-)